MPKSRKRKPRNGPVPQPPSQPVWMADDGMHALIPDEGQDLDLASMPRTYQEKIRHSPLWNTMVAEYGEAKAERMLKDFKVELKP
jgi:hypothetical protein